MASQNKRPKSRQPNNLEFALPKEMEVEPAPQKLRIAVVYSRLPFPMMRGDQLTVAHLLNFLAARGHTIDFFTLGSGGTLSDVQTAWLHRICRTVRIYPHGLLPKAFGAIRGLFRKLPLQVGIFYHAGQCCDIRHGIERGEYDIVYIYYLRSAEVIPGGPFLHKAIAQPRHPTATFLAMQLSQTLNTRRIVENQKGLLRKTLYRIELHLLCEYEAHIWSRFTRTVLIGPRDVEAVRETCRSHDAPEIDNWTYGAHGTDVNRYRPADASEIVSERVVFSGSMSYQPNVQAALWFVGNCWPTVRTQFPDAELVLQGRDPLPRIKMLNGKNGIVVTGTVPDVGAMIRSASVCINPVLAAGGMQNKLLEYLACGKAVVATSIANEGIRATPDQHLLIADQPEGFSEAVVALLRDEVMRTKLGQAGRRFVENHWTWEAHFLKLEANFYEAVGVSKLSGTGCKCSVVSGSNPVLLHLEDSQ